jgi:hypothetical protein
MLDLLVDLIAPLTHGTRLKQAGSTGRLLSYDGDRAILFQSNFDRLCGFRNHAAFDNLMGDGSG